MFFHQGVAQLLDDRMQWGLLLHRNPVITRDELADDVKRHRLIKRQLQLYSSGSPQFNERLLLNHIIIWFNTFCGIEAVDYLLDDMDDTELNALTPFLDYLKVPHGPVSTADQKMEQILQTI